MALRPGGAPLNIANGVREFAQSTPHALAVIDGDRSITYRQLADRAARFANALASQGLAQGARVGVLLGNRLEYCEIAAGLAMGGFVAVPINPRLTPSEATYILEHSGATAIVVDHPLATVSQPWQETKQPVSITIDGTDPGSDYESLLTASTAIDPRAYVDETDPFCITYTSGTTGNPKGVLISHRSRCLTFTATALEWGLGPSKRTIAVAPMYHGAGFAFGYGAVYVGGTVSMLRAFDAKTLLAMIQAFRPSSVFLVPTHGQMLRALSDDVVDSFDTTSLETLYFNAAALPYPLKQWVRTHFPTAGIHELYGSTEAGIVTNLRPAEPGSQMDKANCVGQAWFMTELKLLDDDGRPVAPGTPGELFCRSPFLMNGYLDNDEATAACTTTDGFLSSGDVAIMDEDACVYIVDRKKDLVISGGTNIYPREVEDVLFTHEAIADVAVIGMPHDTWGEQVTACIVFKAEQSATPDELDAHCRQTLGGYKIPRAFVVMDALPRNATGKVLKRELRLSVTL